MESFIEFARGPLLRFALLFMALGLLRNLALAVSGFVRILARTDDRRISWKKILLGAGTGSCRPPAPPIGGATAPSRSSCTSASSSRRSSSPGTS